MEQPEPVLMATHDFLEIEDVDTQGPHQIVDHPAGKLMSLLLPTVHDRSLSVQGIKTCIQDLQQGSVGPRTNYKPLDDCFHSLQCMQHLTQAL